MKSIDWSVFAVSVMLLVSYLLLPWVQLDAGLAGGYLTDLGSGNGSLIPWLLLCLPLSAGLSILRSVRRERIFFYGAGLASVGALVGMGIYRNTEQVMLILEYGFWISFLALCLQVGILIYAYWDD